MARTVGTNLQGLDCLVNQQKAEDYLYSAIAAIDTEINKASIFIPEDPVRSCLKIS